MWGLSLSQGSRSQMLNRGGGTAGQVITHLEIDYSSSEVGDWGEKYLAVYSLMLLKCLPCAAG